VKEDLVYGQGLTNKDGRNLTSLFCVKLAWVTIPTCE
jgi:hypothetical protein